MITVVFHYEGLRFLSIGPWSMRVNPRMEMQIIIFLVFVIHVVEIGVWGIAYWFGDKVLDIGAFGGNHAIQLQDYVYFSVETYTSLGYGDIYPVTVWGKVAAGMIAFAGIGVVALPTGIFASAFSDELREREKARHKPAPEVTDKAA